ncbi:MAG: NapC/NirT family cytochrome c [Candidatus Eisenbacteria bacterium]|uniref:NapC/NirT family cytochrome c n=1 Tax=Eiseniibacteriota bacterium TaxID=2212470 RepID=A0A956LWP5_UNCEI|nr:NapC/NirT family cytochrome c [Candidatus Eisenbacteria bacterium]
MNQRSTDPNRPLPSVFYNTITLIGAGMAALFVGLILFLTVLEWLAPSPKPYVGIITFVVMPVFVIIGLIMVVVGMLRAQRRRRRGETVQEFPRIDLNEPRHRRAVIVFGSAGVLFLILSGFGSFKAYEYTESDEFCGETCHQLMQPEFTSYQLSPHARVGCVECHIGPGATWFVRSKLSGAYQVYATILDKYPRPIPTPIENLRPSRDTCEHCHWPAHFYQENYVKHHYFLRDEGNSPFELDLLMKIGGGNSEGGPTSGIHWHMNIANTVEYVATDEQRQVIPWIRTTGADGKVTVYKSTESNFSDADLAQADVRKMDCIDCHNRPSHAYHPPNQLVNQSMSLSRIPASLPGVKDVSVDALDGGYETTPAALEAIATAIHEHFDKYPEVAKARSADIEQTVSELQRIYQQNYFPEMKVSWKDFPNNIGHLYYPGCFRCHDGLHVNEAGETLTRDCNACHTILAQEMGAEGQRVALEGVEYHHPEDIDEAWKEMNCNECHGP